MSSADDSATTGDVLQTPFRTAAAAAALGLPVAGVAYFIGGSLPMFVVLGGVGLFVVPLYLLTPRDQVSVIHGHTMRTVGTETQVFDLASVRCVRLIPAVRGADTVVMIAGPETEFVLPVTAWRTLKAAGNFWSETNQSVNIDERVIKLL